MIIAIDVYYKENKAKAVGVLFHNWNDSEPCRVVSTYIDNPLEYESGKFYKRELPCILSLLGELDINEIDTIVVDGNVYLRDSQYGLGFYVYESFSGKISVIGVAKTFFQGIENKVVEVTRGLSKSPLFISAVGIDISDAACYISSMSGDYRMPKLLKLLDTETRNWTT